MTESQPEPHIRGHQREGGAWAPTSGHRGRIGSWVAVVLLAVGFALGALSLAVGPAWWLLGVGLLLMLVGAVMSAVSDIFTDVVLDAPRNEPEEPHNTPLHKLKRYREKREDDR